MKSNWVKWEGEWYYTNEGGAIQTGWQKIGLYRYYFETFTSNFPRRMLHDVTIEIDGLQYTFSSNGSMKTGWSYENDGWHLINEIWYYINNNSSMATEWINVNGYWDYLGQNGAMRTGWQYIEEYYYK